MRELPENVETSALIGALADGWDFDVDSAEYAPLGAGSYHWVVTDHEGTRAFVTVDDLDQKPWLGDTRESAFDGLGRAFGTALALRDSGLGFVVAPIPTSSGETVRRLGPRHTIALFPFVAGETGRFGDHDPSERAAVLTMLAELHQATPAVASVARSIVVELPSRHRLEAALQELDQPWTGGPFSEPARQALAEHASDVSELLALADRLAVDIASRSGEWVITHGEPHPGNVLRAGERRLLVDWDTVALAPPERDLWLVVGDNTGHEIDQTAANYFRLRWDLEDLGSYLSDLRSPHRHDEDTEIAFKAVICCLRAAARSG
jgi:spectinomycin phosphotransferase